MHIHYHPHWVLLNGIYHNALISFPSMITIMCHGIYSHLIPTSHIGWIHTPWHPWNMSGAMYVLLHNQLIIFMEYSKSIVVCWNHYHYHEPIDPIIPCPKRMLYLPNLWQQCDKSQVPIGLFYIHWVPVSEMVIWHV